jgi:hypothetical protein
MSGVLEEINKLQKELSIKQDGFSDPNLNSMQVAMLNAECGKLRRRIRELQIQLYA